MNSTGSPSTLNDLLKTLRVREKAQTLFYRALAAAAEEAGDAALAERLNELHADEQHHLSRITARLMEMGEPTVDLTDLERPRAELDGWEEEARRRESDEVRGYEEALASTEVDQTTRIILEEILDSERQHREHLGGKWMSA